MALQHDEVHKIAHLARLDVPSSDIPRYADELGSILALIEQMNRVDTEQVSPLAHPLEQTQRLRTDEVTEDDRRDAFQAIAPAVRDGLYLVPRVIE